MNRIAKIEKFCHKIGILKKPTSQNETTTVFGPYGFMLLEQIRSEWTRIHNLKYASNFMLNGVEILNRKKPTDLDVDSIAQSIRSNFNLNELPLGIINIVEKEPAAAERSQPFLLFKNLSKETELNYIYLNDSAEVDTLVYWQTERRRWWSRHLQCSYNLTLESVKEEAKSRHQFESALVYSMSEADKRKCFLEKLTHFNDIRESKNAFLAGLFSKLEKKIAHNKRDLLIAETSCERILESLLIDSVNEPAKEYVDKLKKHDIRPRADTVFGLDFRLAPYKACVLFKPPQEKKSSSNLSVIAGDLKKMCYMNNVNVFLMWVDSDEKSVLNAKYKHLDEMGVPFCIYLPPTVIKDGICQVRNRDTDIAERTHLSLVAKNFKSYAESLNF
jgi:hypothetical protein